MIKNENIICISSIDWDFVWQGHQEIMSTFAKNDNRVLFIENTGIRSPNFKDIPRLKKRIINWFKSIKGFRKEIENLYVYSPVILPFPYSRIARWINRCILIRSLKNWMMTIEFHDPIIWTFLPTGTALDIINNLEKKLLVYYCIADFYELADNYRKVEKTENELIKISDLIFAQGSMLREKCSRINNNVHVFPFGVNIEAFGNYQDSSDKTPTDMKNIKSPVIGYLGGVHKHIDFKLLKFIAKEHPEWSIVLIGPLQTNTQELNNFKNIFLLGKKDFSELPCHIAKFDVCIIPYKKTNYTLTVYPTKLNEYHALGKPVVSVDLPEVKNFNIENNNLVFIGKTYEEFASRISEALNDSNTVLINKRISSARKNSWAARIEEMSNLINVAISKKSEMQIDWQRKFLKLYKDTKKKIFKLAVISLSAYLLIFYTPLVWFLASPLKIVQSPQKVDCIVAFAGGVGESGKVGQGYEERVKYAVELYNKGYAKHIIFSSGYMYIFKEPIVMKALAISLGVPEEAVILEDKAFGTIQNVEFTEQILLNKGWNKILLISSPYHMRRAAMVFKKRAKNIKVIYTPIPNSLFYSHPERDIDGKKIWKRADLRQIKSILHEYRAILYYWWKGYI